MSHLRAYKETFRAVLAIAVMFAFSFSSFAPLAVAQSVEESGENDKKISLCHYDTDLDTYEILNVAKDSINNNPNGHDEHENDIIPAFDDYPGKNWDEDGMTIWENDCVDGDDQEEPGDDFPEDSCDAHVDIQLNDSSDHDASVTDNVTSFTIDGVSHGDGDSFDLFESGDASAEGAFTDEVRVERTADGFELYFYGDPNRDPKIVRELSGSFQLEDVDYSSADWEVGSEPLENATYPDYVDVDTTTGVVTFKMWVSTGHDSFIVTGVVPSEECDEPEPEDPWCSYEGFVIEYTDPAHKNNGDPVNPGRRGVAGIEGGPAPYANFGGSEGGAWSEADFFSLGIEGELVYEFIGQVAYDQAGDDIAIYETTGGSGDTDEKVDVWVSENGVDFVSVATLTGDGSIDISGTGLAYVKYVKLIDNSVGVQGGNGDGFDVDAIVILDGSCDDEPDEPEGTKIVAHKVMCEAEEYLPNWGDGAGPDIDGSTAQDWVDQSEGHCWLEEDWNFQWAVPGTSNPGDNTGEAEGNWTTLTPTDEDGMTMITIDLDSFEGSYVWMREVWDEEYVPFTGVTKVEDVSAEFHCHIDHLNYDNFDRVDNLQEDETYYCVGFNAPVEPRQEINECSLELVSDTGNLVVESEAFAVETYDEHPAWTASIPGATWIWNTFAVEHPTTTEVYTFKNTFEWHGDVATATLDIAADNEYRVWLNGVLVGSDNGGDNFSLAGQDQYSGNVLINEIVQGENVLTVEVTNRSGNANPTKNPAGALYKLVLEGTSEGDEICRGVDLEEEEGDDDDNGGGGNGPHKPQCNGLDATIYVDDFDKIVGGPNSGDLYTGTLVGTSGDDVIVGTADADMIFGKDGDDTICGRDGDDEIHGGDGDDYAEGNRGKDTIFGGDGSDELRGNQDSDHLEGEDGDDEMHGGNGSDEMHGGDGADTMYGGNNQDLMYGDDGDDMMYGNGADDEMYGGDGDDYMEGNRNNDYVCGDDGDDVLRGQGGDDVLCGKDGNDNLNGGSGADKLAGGADTDDLNGAGGSDVCLSGETTANCESLASKEVFCHENDDDDDDDDNDDGDDDEEEDEDDDNDSSEDGEERTRRGGSRRGGGGSGGPSGAVLGASTGTCPLWLHEYLGLEFENNPSEVLRLQAFLNWYGITAPTHAIFDQATYEAVMEFQAQHSSDVLNPWASRFSVLDNAPSGVVYQTTKWKINNIVCPGIEEFPGQLVMLSDTSI